MEMHSNFLDDRIYITYDGLYDRDDAIGSIKEIVELCRSKNIKKYC